MRIAYPTYAVLILVAGFFGLLLWLDTPAGYTQEAPPTLHQLTNQHTGVASSSPAGFTEFKGAAYFGLSSDRGGLWKTDGTADGTLLIKDLHITPASIQRVGDLLYFVSYDDAHQSVLWKSDGTAEGTSLIKDDLPIYTYQFVALGNYIYFTAFDAVHGTEMWQSDGTPEGTKLFADLIPGEESSYPNQFVVSNNMLYFKGSDAQNNSVLWQSDGTPAGTRVVAETPSYVDKLVVMQNVLYFVGYTETTGEELWRYAPGDQAPSLVLDIAPGQQSAAVDQLLVVNDRLFFVANDRVHGYGLWLSDGTTAGTTLLKAIAPGQNEVYIYALTRVNDLVYFIVSNPSFSRSLWKSDGTAAGTNLVKELVEGTTTFYPDELTAMNGQLYFLTSTASELRLWKSDGTAVGTVAIVQALTDLYTNNSLTAIGNRLYFSAHDELHGGELWASDGTAAGTAFVVDLDTNYIGANFNNFIQVNQRLYFTKFTGGPWSGSEQLWMSQNSTSQAVLIDDQLGAYPAQSIGDTLFVASYSGSSAALWKHEGTSGPLQLVKRFARGGLSNFVTFNNQLFFLVRDESNSLSPTYDLWRSDGTEEGTIKLIQGTAATPAPTPRQVFNGHILATQGQEIWLLDGTATGITHFVPAGMQGTISTVVSTPTALYFIASQTIDIFSDIDTLWRSDGTPQGTRQLSFDSEVTYIQSLMPVDNSLYLVASGQGYSRELWYYDGVSPSIKRLVSLNAARFYSNFSWMTLANGQLFFTADDGIHGPEVWRSNGTVEGTILVKDIIPAELSDIPNAYPGPLFAFDNLLYFSANDGLHGQELWRSDGSTAGTVLFKDIKPNAGSSAPDSFIGQRGLFFFSADDGTHGRELWQSDGTVDGTRLVTDLYAGASGAAPVGHTIYDNILYFTGNNGLDGQQLFSLQTTVVPLALPVVDEPSAPHHLYLPLVR